MLGERIGVDDGMMVRLTVAPSGAVTGAAVRTSTSPNPELDAAAVKTMMDGHFAPINGGEVTADYPIISPATPLRPPLSIGPRNQGGHARCDVPLHPSTPLLQRAVPSVSPPPVEATAPVVTTPSKPKRHKRVAAARPPKPALLEQVQSALRSNRKLQPR